jgi:nucleotide-binding universal stress UspA family protein
MTSPARTGNPRATLEQLAPWVVPGVDTSIVVGVDGSPTSWDALSWALGEAKRRSSRVIAVYVIPTAELAAEAMAAAVASYGYVAAKQAETDAADGVQEEAEAQANRLGVPLAFMRAEGDSAQELLQVAQSAHSDLIVIGRSSKTLHHLAGSLGRRLVSNRKAPAVVVVP